MLEQDPIIATITDREGNALREIRYREWAKTGQPLPSGDVLTRQEEEMLERLLEI